MASATQFVPVSDPVWTVFARGSEWAPSAGSLWAAWLLADPGRAGTSFHGSLWVRCREMTLLRGRESSRSLYRPVRLRSVLRSILRSDLFKMGAQVWALLCCPSWVCHSGLICVWRSWDVWGPQESRSLALRSMLMLTSSVRCALWMAVTLRTMKSRVRGWWRPLFFTRSHAAFSLSTTDSLTQRSLAVKEKSHF